MKRKVNWSFGIHCYGVQLFEEEIFEKNVYLIRAKGLMPSSSRADCNYNLFIDVKNLFSVLAVAWFVDLRDVCHYVF